jgi:hypothetical protein
MGQAIARTTRRAAGVKSRAARKLWQLVPLLGISHPAHRHQPAQRLLHIQPLSCSQRHAPPQLRRPSQQVCQP